MTTSTERAGTTAPLVAWLHKLAAWFTRPPLDLDVQDGAVIKQPEPRLRRRPGLVARGMQLPDIDNGP